MSTSTALEFGVINTLRTGHAVYDLVVCMVVPAVVQRIASSGYDALRFFEVALELLCCLFFPRKYVKHVIETKEVSGGYRTYRPDDGSKGNELLQKAILLYLTEHLDLHDKSGRYDLLERPNAKKLLVETEFGHLDLEKQKRLKALLDQPASPEVAKLAVSVLPPLNQWVAVAEGVEFLNETEKNDDEKTTVQETKTLFHLRSKLPDGPERIDAFVEKAFAFYRDLENKKFKSDTARYMYVRSSERPAATDTDDESKLSAPYHKRYALGNDKTFDNVFFDEKESLLQLLDHFANKTGKFAIEGFPNKVGLLLYGPPGTGKTSVIKAVAEKTRRHIVNIPLGKIKTNQELMDAMFDLRYAVDGLDLPVRMGFKDVVFVMEDIDCASSVVASREDGPTTPDDGFLSVLLQSQMEFEGFGPKLKGGFVSSSNSTDKLNLAGVLNVLDGVIDCPGRIVIMTTNHPEMLDPALVRPGRISKKLHLDYMSTEQMGNMISYYFLTTLTAEQRSRLETLEDSDRVFTPADIEELCAEHESADRALERMLR
ncbi:hypothetical protein PHYSODRAFT_551868 [Phytophthora sojae]|uniref:AAA+ ATPase domain-containing protein n=1 Tax=Phytophthora sojae (strain P6497) TaxID=1094619 RepID=G4YI17_PHYSP|nr:hypothetical protein PHYSODRAFT_551868 [Phytophthora sojae]EGZ26604.1 hypothetical protein PHYSODRAFT_551868 [Phytophthora sojae]|eukprot:XP_009513879.1 hypothetical protein PHYSODRAFT_551868 [Phytophthora sojae]